MKIKLLRKKSNELRIEIAGEGHTFCNMLQKALLEDETVEMAGYTVPHPLMTKAIVYVHTKGRRGPETAIREAAKKLRTRSTELKSALEKAFQEYDKMAGDC
ncbi:MAG: DNA-directed RNA polymerase subunit L [Candidatus Bathyarchaeota archaeon]|nr:MAG: DNA-directed RNA polymerase subunit L [Candidatus Bathyarchaeota archaeon]